MMMRMSLARDAVIALGALVAASCVVATPASDAATSLPTAAISVQSAPLRTTALRGGDFPDGVLALTWDDGPDAHSLELAQYLHAQHVAGTFFVVRSWEDGVSEEPGFGKTKLETGYGYVPILGDLMALGHRVGNHTRNHVLLGHATTALIEEQFESLPITSNRVRMFRAPGGWWTDETAAAFSGAAFDDLVGPIHWDIDAKDWECSLYCCSDAPARECEPGPKPNEPRVKPAVIAARYLKKIESWKHGIVLMHDRVGDVGSRYALDVAQALVPALIERDYVFAAPVLHFAAFERVDAAPSTHSRTGDLNGDGRSDTCRATEHGIACALMGAKGPKAETIWSSERAQDFTLADVNGDGRADLCVGDRCALAP
jgi:peptidoglycan/xylan/chitin deacetylase (PgdA/CDA1 family)